MRGDAQGREVIWIDFDTKLRPLVSGFLIHDLSLWSVVQFIALDFYSTYLQLFVSLQRGYLLEIKTNLIKHVIILTILQATVVHFSSDLIRSSKVNQRGGRRMKGTRQKKPEIKSKTVKKLEQTLAHTPKKQKKGKLDRNSDRSNRKRELMRKN